MKLRTKKMLSLLLASAMVFTMNTAVFAEEVTVDAAEEFVEVDSVDSVEEIPGIEAEVASVSWDTLSANDVSGNSVSEQNLKILVENGEQVKENLSTYETQSFKDTDYSFALRYTKAVGYDSRKLGLDGSKKDNGGIIPVKVQLFYFKGASENAISKNSLSNNQVSSNTVPELNTGWVDISNYIKDVKFHQAKGATVDISGNGLVAAKDCAYITDIKLDKKELTDAAKEGLDKKAINTLQKQLSNSLKTTAKDIKKNKTDLISANGIPVGKGENDKIENVIAVYPAYAYAYYDQISLDIANEWAGMGLNCFYIGDPKKDELDLTSKKIIALDKKNNKEVKSIKGYFTWYVGEKTKTKKVTLKPDKVQTGKATKLNGLYTTKEKAKTVTAVKSADDKMYTVNASGNVFGVISFDPDAVK